MQYSSSIKPKDPPQREQILHGAVETQFQPLTVCNPHVLSLSSTHIGVHSLETTVEEKHIDPAKNISLYDCMTFPAVAIY
jgi:hypothetical protein